MIIAALMIYIGVQLQAAWWYYVLIGIYCLCGAIKFGAKYGKK
jgi:hypothetical protein